MTSDIKKQLDALREHAEKSRPGWARDGDHCSDRDCPCQEFRKARDARRCSLGEPLWMVVPPEGTHVTCPVHGKHFIPGSGAVFCSSQGPIWRATS